MPNSPALDILLVSDLVFVTKLSFRFLIKSRLQNTQLFFSVLYCLVIIRKQQSRDFLRVVGMVMFCAGAYDFRLFQLNSMKESKLQLWCYEVKTHVA